MPVFLVIHGGPGAGSDAALLDLFDLNRVRVLQIDQRGAGRSLPPGNLVHNTTDDLLDDIQAVRRHLGIGRWTVLGGSWGTTLAILHAAADPAGCDGLILRGITEWGRAKFEWCLHHRRFIRPFAHDHLLAILDEEERADILGAYHRRILAGDEEAARRWNLYEQQFSLPVPPVPPGDTSRLPADFIRRARIHIHYWANGAFIDDQRWDAALSAIVELKVHIVHGSLDMMCPPVFAANLVGRLPRATLAMVPGGGHSISSPPVRAALAEAIAAFTPPLKGVSP